MNSMNSVIIEGKVFSKGKIEEIKGSKRLEVCLETSRTLKKEDGSIQILKERFTVELWGEMAEVFGERIKKEAGISVVGRLRQGFNGRVSILAVHIELKRDLEEAERKI